MELNQARQVVYDRFIALWKDDADAPLCPFVFDNEKGNGEPTWARCSVRSMPGGQSTLGPRGGRKFHRKALVRVEIYTPPAKGLETADRLTRAALEMFEAEAIAGLKMFDAETAEAGLVDEGRWFLSTVQVSFDYEEIK